MKLAMFVKCQSCERVQDTIGGWITPPVGSDLERHVKFALKLGEVSHGICPIHAAEMKRIYSQHEH